MAFELPNRSCRLSRPGWEKWCAFLILEPIVRGSPKLAGTARCARKQLEKRRPDEPKLRDLFSRDHVAAPSRGGQTFREKQRQEKFRRDPKRIARSISAAHAAVGTHCPTTVNRQLMDG